MRVMGCVESKELRKRLKEARVVGARPPDHRRARLERDVDRCDWVIAHRCRGLFCRPDARKERYKFVDNGLSFPPPPLGVRLYRRARARRSNPAPAVLFGPRRSRPRISVAGDSPRSPAPRSRAASSPRSRARERSQTRSCQRRPKQS